MNETMEMAPPTCRFADAHGDEPLRAELLGLERLESHARALARDGRDAVPWVGVPLLQRFARNRQTLLRAHQRLSATPQQSGRPEGEVEWLLDNHHIVVDVLREISTDLPFSYYRLLPKLGGGPLAGYPRVYGIALELVAHCDSSLDEAHMTRFLQAYQEVTALTIGELWAFPTMLRLVLVDNLRRLAESVLQAQEDREGARKYTDAILAQKGSSGDPRQRSQIKTPLPDWSDAFVIRLYEELRDHGATAAEESLEKALVAGGQTIAEVVGREQRLRAANQVSIGNCVASLRLLSALDWTALFERTSVVEAILRQDPAGIYAQQNMAARDRYRQIVERLARGSKLSEPEIAERAQKMAGGSKYKELAPVPVANELHEVRPEQHIGYYLVGDGQAELEAVIDYRPRLKDRWHRLIAHHPQKVFFGGIALLTFGLTLGAAVWADHLWAMRPWTLGLVAAVCFLPAWELAIGWIHGLITHSLRPRVLPKLSFQEGIPPSCATFVVIPCLLSRRESSAVLLERLEIHYLSNPDPELWFALLTDFGDAPNEQMPEDELSLSEALAGVAALNERHADNGRPRFFLCHRRRQWNPAQNCWMGWERKRGKLLEFNRLLRGDKNTSFATVSDDFEGLPFIRYVITLDADTQLPRETARRLIATLAHPLNKPRIDPERKRVVSGYAILQPRIGMSLIGAGKSWFAFLFSQSAGIDPYAVAVSDVNQDLFGEGSFTGKGIYDIDAFEVAVRHAFPENCILSHDLIEGNYARCGLASDIELIDHFPARYNTFALREHRWVRGDWQILPWLLAWVPGQGGKRVRNPLSLVERWKILDNLRRSLLPSALLLLLVVSWTIAPQTAWASTAVVSLVLMWPFARVLLALPMDLMRSQKVDSKLWTTAGQVVLAAAFLPNQAWIMLDAMVRTLWRVFVSRRHLLEWETAASTEHRLGNDLLQSFRDMWPAPVLATILAIGLGLSRPEVLFVAGPFVIGWWLAPLIAYWISRPLPVKTPTLTDEERRRLFLLARKTWNFFETYVGNEDNWLPPDNYQEDPKDQVAHRTSPTNIGLYLLSAVTAHDFGYLSLPMLLERLEMAFATLERLEQVHGHFLNWYDTQSLAPLQPRYLSTVDSGNLLASLLVLKNALTDKANQALSTDAIAQGIRTTAELVVDSFRSLEPPHHPTASNMIARLEKLLAELNGQSQEKPDDLPGLQNWLEHLELLATDLTNDVQGFAELIRDTPHELIAWVSALRALVRDHQHELSRRAPWLVMLREAPTDFQRITDAVPDGSPISAEFIQRCQALRNKLRHLGSLTLTSATRNSEGYIPSMISDLQREWPSEDGRQWMGRIKAAVESSAADELLGRCQRLATRAETWASAMDFKKLYNEPRHLFSVGFNLSLGRLDPAHYDLLASEASLTSFLAIARGDVPQRHWFQLGRPVTRVGHGLALYSWGGTMFEYLMPRLFLCAFPTTLLAESQQGAVELQIEYGKQCASPWGISESAFSMVDGDLNYQYQAFGAPGLGLKRGLNRDLVVAPYATFLAVGICPRSALSNLARLTREGAEGWHGYNEAVDYTRDRLQPRQRSTVVKCYMAHHQGMSLLALANCLLDELVCRRLQAEPMVRATELLLQERVPAQVTAVTVQREDSGQPPATVDSPALMCRRLSTPDTAYPRTHLLSNGQYSVMVTNAGATYSTCWGMDVTRWREDRTRDNWGQFCYLRDERSGLVWAAGHQPICRAADDYEVVYATDKAEFRRVDGMLETRLEIAVTPEHPAEIRRVVVTNHDSRDRVVELTSYLEIVLAARGADRAHPAFGKLFLETEFVAAEEALLCKRRPRTGDQKPIWAVHVLAHDGTAVGPLQMETDRGRFLGRGRSTANPVCLESGASLSGTTGPVLDPIFSLRRKVRVPAHGSAHLAFTTAVANTREEALTLADQYHEFHSITRVFELTWAHSQVELRHHHLSAEEAHLFQRLASHVFFAGPRLRASAAVLAANRLGQPGLWRHGISGDKPIVLVRISKSEEVNLVRQLLIAHIYWRLKGLEVDLVILNEHEGGYFEELQKELQSLVRAGEDRNLLDQPGGVFIRRATHMSKEDLMLLQAAARCVLVGIRGTLTDQLERLERLPTVKEIPKSLRWKFNGKISEDVTRPIEPSADRLFDNGIGGFSSDGREYILSLQSDHKSALTAGLSHANGALMKPAKPSLPPAPWINVIANGDFGFLVSETGASCTWAGNSQTNRLTPWNNDPVSDTAGEAIYVRDEDTGEVWSPTSLPVAGAAPTRVRHGQGYTIFEQNSHGIRHELRMFVSLEDPIKLVCLKVRNLGRRPRRLSATFYAEWVLGAVREQTAMHVTSSVDPASGAVLARNAFNSAYASHVAFADISVRPRSFTTDRNDFLGRNGSPASPQGLKQAQLGNAVGAGLDPCVVLQGLIDLKSGEEREIVFFLGQAAQPEEVSKLLDRYREPGAVGLAYAAMTRFWDGLLSTIQVRTPDKKMDLLLNRWLLYQVLSCRVWGRTAFYQSSGAFGFRDQLQDVMALIHAAPQLARSHILKAASRQFLEGDVQHWWHDPDGAGVRARFSDDFLWLPFVVLNYVSKTGDKSILGEQVHFLEAPMLRPEQEEDYRVPATSKESATLYEHCARALQHGCRFGSHGLPLMGTGDWNDGMNWVGREGKGESVWTGWFLLTILRDFVSLTRERGEPQREKLFSESMENLRKALDEHGWDGAWYRRAYFDNGMPLGSAENDDCRIDSLPQSWAVISGAGDPAKARRAMEAVAKRLVSSEDMLIKLFTPPFNKSQMEPGYIKGYVPGTRENGGQYTHAATWVVQAFAMLGQGNKAVKFFDWLNPITHASTPEAVARYRIEPYVVAGDVYGEPPLNGRGGWSWYSGAAGWLYRVALETILGFQLQGSRLTLDPCISGAWPEFEIAYRFGTASYWIVVKNPSSVERGVQSVTVDGALQAGNTIELVDDGKEHTVQVVLAIDCQ